MPDTDLISLSKEDMPSGKVSVGLKYPYFHDQRTAKRNYPRPQGNEKGPSYIVEELLLANLLDNINGKRPWMTKRNKEVIERLDELEISDKQFLVAFLLEAFYLSNQQMKEVREKADEIKLNYKQVYTVEAEDTPSGQHTVSFRRPNTGVLREAERRWQGEGTNGCALEEMLFAYCVDTIDGEQVDRPKDIISIFDDWEIADVSYLSNMFVMAFSMDDNTEGEKARDLAKKKMEKAKTKVHKKKQSQEKEEPSSTDGSTSPSNDS